MRHLATLNFENISEANIAGFRKRTAARAIIQDAEGKIALLHVSNHGYYKLPGGGVEDGEDIKIALHRECKEEAGCAVLITEEVGTVTEVRGEHRFTQDSHAYLAQLSGEKGMPELTELESASGFEVCWVPIEEALSLLKKEGVEGYVTQYIVQRDSAIVEAAMKMLNSTRPA